MIDFDKLLATVNTKSSNNTLGIVNLWNKVNEYFPGVLDSSCKIINENISITQQDIYQLITAKAGLRIDQDLLIGYYGVGLEDIEKIYLAGGFGNFINTESAISIGLLPNAGEKVVKIGNGALAGAREMILSRKMRMEAEEVVDRIEHAKPNEREPDFAYMVAEKMYF